MGRTLREMDIFSVKQLQNCCGASYVTAGNELMDAFACDPWGCFDRTLSMRQLIQKLCCFSLVLVPSNMLLIQIKIMKAQSSKPVKATGFVLIDFN